MATISTGYLGGFSGSLGPVVGYQWRGRWCLRAKPQLVKNPRTEEQQRHRMMFREEVRLAARMNWVLRETLEELSLAEGLTPCNYFVKDNQRCFGLDEERLTVDWSRLALSHGPVAPVAFDVPEVSEGTVLTIDFEKNPLHVSAGQYDKVYLYVFCPEVEQGFLSAPVYRRAQRLSVALPEVMAGREVQLWGLVQDSAGRWSETIYIGYGPLEETEDEVEEMRMKEVAGPASPDKEAGAEGLTNQAGFGVPEGPPPVDGLDGTEFARSKVWKKE